MPLLLAFWAPGGQAGPSHTPAIVDTVRYNRDEFGLKLHVPTGWKGTPALLYPGPKQTIRAAPLSMIDGTTYRGRYKPGATMQYAFWLGANKYKAGSIGPMLDKDGDHETATPDWFTQKPADYPDHRVAQWPGEGAILYALNPDTFGDGTVSQRGAMSLDKNATYIAGLSATGVWLVGNSSENADAAEIAKRTDLRVVCEGAPVKGADGVEGSPPATGKDLWRVLLTDGDAHEQLSASGADTVQDRRWTQLVAKFVKDSDYLPTEFSNALSGLWGDYPDGAASEMVMRLAGPNQPRPSTLFHGDPKRLSQAWTLLFTLPGVPVFDAGDEIGLLDADGKMNWDPTVMNATISDTVKLLASLRLSRRSLYRGDYNVLLTDDDQHAFAFLRTDRIEMTVVVINNGDLPANFHLQLGGLSSNGLRVLVGSDSFTPLGGDLRMSISPHSCDVIGN